MKIIKNGITKEQIFKNYKVEIQQLTLETYNKLEKLIEENLYSKTTCTECSCKFELEKEDVIVKKNSFSDYNYLFTCPDCKTEYKKMVKNLLTNNDYALIITCSELIDNKIFINLDYINEVIKRQIWSRELNKECAD